MSDCSETLEDFLDTMLHNFSADQATGYSLDQIAASFLGYSRHPGEADAEFRRRLYLRPPLAVAQSTTPTPISPRRHSGIAAAVV